ncbi:MAG TPA: hypothetical protein VEC99_05210, partial [Clostridia bacterium]|nr:hypothetical protein [Clostridia bacterium]
QISGASRERRLTLSFPSPIGEPDGQRWSVTCEMEHNRPGSSVTDVTHRSFWAVTPWAEAARLPSGHRYAMQRARPD